MNAEDRARLDRWAEALPGPVQRMAASARNEIAFLTDERDRALALLQEMQGKLEALDREGAVLAGKAMALRAEIDAL